MEPKTNDKFPNHLIYPDGRVYSKRLERFMKPHENSNGYLRVTIGGGKHTLLHRLILETFTGPPPKNMKRPSCNHIDGNKKNNHYLNLEWMERGYNTRLGHPGLLSQEKYDQIIDLYNTKKYSFRAIGRIVGCDHKTVISHVRST